MNRRRPPTSAATCVVPAAGVIGEAMVAIVLAQAMLEKFGGDSLRETRRNYEGYLEPGEEFLMIYPIVKYGDPVLETQAATVDRVRYAGAAQAARGHVRVDVRGQGRGPGGAADRRFQTIAVIDCSNGERPEEKIVLINPEIIKVEGTQTSEEGCLSIPGFREHVTRGKRVTVRAQNAKGEWFEMTGEDLLARAFLHETDHLNGKLYITHVSVLKRDLIKREDQQAGQSRRVELRSSLRFVFMGTPRVRRAHAEAAGRSRTRGAGGVHAAGPAERPRAATRAFAGEGSGAAPAAAGVSAGAHPAAGAG